MAGKLYGSPASGGYVGVCVASLKTLATHHALGSVTVVGVGRGDPARNSGFLKQ